MSVPSTFTYERSIVRDVAATLNDLQSQVPDPATLAVVVRALADTFCEHDPRFDTEDFLDRCTIGKR